MKLLISADREVSLLTMPLLTSYRDRSDHTELVHTALHMVLLQRRPGAELIHHSDRGSEYASNRDQTLLREHDIQANMSKKGDCYDNSMIESFWASLKKECAGNGIFSSRDEAKITIFEYIEVYDNLKRRHSSLGYLSPSHYEKQNNKTEDDFS